MQKEAICMVFGWRGRW